MLNGTWSESNVSLITFNLQKRFCGGQISIKFRLPFNLSIHGINHEKRWFHYHTRHFVEIVWLALYLNIWLIIKTFIIWRCCCLCFSCILPAFWRIIRHNLFLNHLQYTWRYKPLNLPMIMQPLIGVHQRVALVILRFQVTNSWIINIWARWRMANYDSIYHDVKVAADFVHPVWVGSEVDGLVVEVRGLVFVD